MYNVYKICVLYTRITQIQTTDVEVVGMEAAVNFDNNKNKIYFRLFMNK